MDTSSIEQVGISKTDAGKLQLSILPVGSMPCPIDRFDGISMAVCDGYEFLEEFHELQNALSQICGQRCLLLASKLKFTLQKHADL